jgi:hypothetical protein
MKYRTSWKAFALIAAVGLGLTACGGSPSVSATSPSVESTASATTSAPVTTSAPATQEAKKSARGNFVKALGEPTAITSQVTKKQVANFAINAITLDAPCTNPLSEASQNGHYVVLDIAAETTPELAESSFPRFNINSTMFRFVGADGTTYNGRVSSIPSLNCLPASEAFPVVGMAPGEKVGGKIVLDVPEPSGTIVFRPEGSKSGWEWTF